MEQEKEKDPLPRMEDYVLAQGYINQAELESLKNTCFQKVEESALQADQIPFPDVSTSDANVFKECEEIQESTSESSSSAEDAVVMVDALNHALEEEMAKDPTVVVFGQDVAHGKGGVFGVTRNLTSRFGVERCFNTPLAESCIVGLSIGLAFSGLKPVAEVQFADYVWTGVNQLLNELASIHYRSNGEWNCPGLVS